MADWATISSIATAGGTLVLAIATYSAVRSSNRSARIAERTLLLGLRPVLISSRPEDPTEEVRWGGGHASAVPGGMAHVAVEDGIVYVAIAVRNVGTGLAVLQGWHMSVGRPTGDDGHPAPEEFRRQRRDLYIPAGGTGFWQAALRDPEEELAQQLTAAIAERTDLTVFVMYGDHEGGQLTISLFGLMAEEGDRWIAEVGRHWSLDAPDPRLRPD